MKKVLITSGAGFIDGHLVDRLVHEDYFVRVIDNFSTGRPENLTHHAQKDHPRMEIIRGDLKDYSETEEAVKDVGIFHFAFNPKVRVSTLNPEIYYNENILSMFNLLEATRENWAKELVFASSSSAYGEPSIIPVDKNHRLAPISVYGAIKAARENLIHAYSQLYGIRAIVLRYANIIDPRPGHGIVLDLLVKLKPNNERLEVLGDETQIKSYVHIDDTIEATLFAWKYATKPHDIYDVASNDRIEVKTVATTILNELKLEDTRIECEPVLHEVSWSGGVKKVALDNRKLKGLSFQTKLGSAEAVRITTRNLVKELNSKSSRRRCSVSK